MDKKIDEIEQLTKVGLDEQLALFRRLVKMNIHVKLTVMKQHRKILYMIKQSHELSSIEVGSYAALVLAIKQVYTHQNELKVLNFENMSLDEIKDISVEKAELFLHDKFQRKKPKREMLLKHWAVVKTLKNNGFTFRDIKNYLETVHKQTVGTSTIFGLWCELEKKEN